MQFIDLKTQYERLRTEIDENIRDVLHSGNYLMGTYVKTLEYELSKYVGTKYCITCANGTDALQLALMTWKVKQGDAVFVPSFTFYSTAEVVSILGATPIFVDVCPNTFNMDVEKLEKAIIEVKKVGKLHLKAIIPVDLFGRPADFMKINILAKKYELYVLEDGAQGFGGSMNGKKSCSFGDLATTSFFPAKPLGCYGDGGAIFTDSEEYYDVLCSLRVHGKGSFKYDHVRIGMNSRLDELQAAILLPKLKAFKDYELNKREMVANSYTTQLEGYVNVPYVSNDVRSSWAQYTIQLTSKEERTYIQKQLKEKGIPTMIYYPKPLHKQCVYASYDFNLADLKVSETISNICLSLPMHPYLNDVDIVYISNTLIKLLTIHKCGGKYEAKRNI